MISVLNMGHRHPKILAAATNAMKEGAVVSIQFHSLLLWKFGKIIAQGLKITGILDKYSDVLETIWIREVRCHYGADAADTADAAVEIAGKWEYVSKNIVAGVPYPNCCCILSRNYTILSVTSEQGQRP
jgi:ornithine--oxo-acid transaminase